MDQSKASDRHQILTLSLHWGERALPLAWRVEATEGVLGFARQKDLLDAVTAWLPQQADICLMADGFYGTPDLIALAQAKGEVCVDLCRAASPKIAPMLSAAVIIFRAAAGRLHGCRDEHRRQLWPTISGALELP